MPSHFKRCFCYIPIQLKQRSRRRLEGHRFLYHWQCCGSFKVLTCQSLIKVVQVLRRKSFKTVAGGLTLWSQTIYALKNWQHQRAFVCVRYLKILIDSKMIIIHPLHTNINNTFFLRKNNCFISQKKKLAKRAALFYILQISLLSCWIKKTARFINPLYISSICCFDWSMWRRSGLTH